MKRARRPSPQTLPAPLGRALLNLAALAALGGAALPVAAQAIEYRSVGAAALLRAQPAAEAEALYRLRPGTPVEIVVRVFDREDRPLREPVLVTVEHRGGARLLLPEAGGYRLAP